jgi:uncharacterized protein
MGQLLRILIIVAVVWLAIHLVRRALAQRRARQDEEPAGQIPRMLPCAHCGVYVPESQAVFAGGKHYCSEEHSRAGRS